MDFFFWLTEASDMLFCGLAGSCEKEGKRLRHLTWWWFGEKVIFCSESIENTFIMRAGQGLCYAGKTHWEETFSSLKFAKITFILTVH